MRTVKVLLPLAMLIGVVGMVTTGSADVDAGAPTWQHAAKFICGVTGGGPVAAGDYRTAINVHNPNSTTVRGTGTGSSTSSSFSPGFRKKALLLFPPPPEGGDVPKEVATPPGAWFRPPNLPADWGFEIDCADIRDVLLAGEPREDTNFVKGFVVIEATGKLPLDVTAAYTVQREVPEEGAATGVSNGIDVETIQPKKIRSG